MPPFISFVSFLGPLIGLALGFDAINGEHNKGTLSLVLAQPIFRDDVINGKFLTGLAVLAQAVFSLGMVVAGLGLLFTGVPPTAEESARLLLYQSEVEQVFRNARVKQALSHISPTVLYDEATITRKRENSRCPALRNIPGSRHGGGQNSPAGPAGRLTRG